MEYEVETKYTSNGKYGIGTFIGEEWIYQRQYTVREETCVAAEESAVLEISVKSFDAIRHALINEMGLAKDMSMFESQIKRSYTFKK